MWALFLDDGFFFSFPIKLIYIYISSIPNQFYCLTLSKLVCNVFGLVSLDGDIPVLDLYSKLSHQPVLLFLRDPYVLPTANGNQTCHLLTVLYLSAPYHKNHIVINGCWTQILIIWQNTTGVILMLFKVIAEKWTFFFADSPPTNKN